MGRRAVVKTPRFGNWAGIGASTDVVDVRATWTQRALRRSDARCLLKCFLETSSPFDPRSFQVQDILVAQWLLGSKTE